MKKTIYTAKDVCRLTPETLHTRGIRAVLCDLDNTLAGYKVNAPDETVLAWIQALEFAGIPLFVISNAGFERVESFCQPLRLPYFASAGKPRGKKLREALRVLNMKADDTVMVGDQFFTDVMAGRNAGIRVVLVPPRVKGFFTTLRKWLEQPFILFFRGGMERYE